MKNTKKWQFIKKMAIIAFAVIIGFSMAACEEGGEKDVAVTLNSVTANGSSTQTTTQLTLTFDKAITGLTAADITLSGVSGVSKGTLSGSNSYTLPISGFTSNGTLSVAVSKSGYNISGSPKSAYIYYYLPPTSVAFNSVTANGSSTQTTTELTLNFDKAITGLTAADITLSGVSGVSKGTLSGSNPYTLPISGFTSGGTLNVAVSKSSYNISGSPKSAYIYYYLPPTSVAFNSVTANGSSTQTTTELTLTFDNDIDGLTADDIILSGVSGVSKGTFSGSGTSYTLGISGFSSGGTLNVAVASPSGYTISGSPKTVVIYYAIPVTLNSVTANGSSTQTTTELTLTFDNEIDGLSAADITLNGVSGVSKETLSGSNPYTLPISGFYSGGTLNVAVSKSGYDISGSPKTVVIYVYIPVEMVQISGGTFQMGSPDTEAGRSTSEGPQHSVTLSGFYMGKYEVTQEQWVAVMGSNPSNFTSSPASGEVQNKRPVEMVSWYDAIVFCNKLSVLEGLTPAYSISGSTDPSSWGDVPTYSHITWNAVEIVSGSTGYRLPTEAQWEYACRAGTTTAYNTGNAISDNTGWYIANSGGETHEVGLKPPNAWGLYDMHGNVYEWCWDWYGSNYYSSSPANDPVGAVSGSSRVARGGGWIISAESVRSACRGYSYPSDRFDNVGFRLARP